ncbi:hypothetical protein NE237_004176 [Protea cynaroides]|uniref:Uncharacterized protein n=1 Tax=Protea cynaroides TaxID=273540 RepID=A0A9Q0KIA8_9MAGN|nr:hypothetical protein NE237_004176 [Protea cynaroides]
MSSKRLFCSPQTTYSSLSLSNNITHDLGTIAETVPAQRCFVVFMAFHNFSHRAKKKIKQMEFKDFPTSLKEKNPNTFRRKEGSRFDELKMEKHHMNPFTMIFRFHSIFTSVLSHNVSLSLTKRKPLFLCSSKQNQSIFFFFSDSPSLFLLLLLLFRSFSPYFSLFTANSLSTITSLFLKPKTATWPPTFAAANYLFFSRILFSSPAERTRPLSPGNSRNPPLPYFLISAALLFDCLGFFSNH